MNVFQLFIKSTYSPRDIAKTRFQGIGKAILYVFLLSVLFAIPTAYYVSSGTVKSMNGFKTVLNKDFPDFTISNGKLQTDEKKPRNRRQMVSLSYLIRQTPTAPNKLKQSKTQSASFRTNLFWPLTDKPKRCLTQ